MMLCLFYRFTFSVGLYALGLLVPGKVGKKLLYFRADDFDQKLATLKVR